MQGQKVYAYRFGGEEGRVTPDRYWRDVGTIEAYYKAIIEKSILFRNVRVGVGARLKNCIIDKSVVIPPEEQIGHDLATDRQRFAVTENGIVVVPHGVVFASYPAKPDKETETARSGCIRFYGLPRNIQNFPVAKIDNLLKRFVKIPSPAPTPTGHPL